MDIEKTLQEFFVADLSLLQDMREEALDLAALDLHFKKLSKYARRVYTAFDGDHELLCGLMRRMIAADGGLAVNTDSILGYKDTAQYHQSKRGVLLDDLTLLRKCDEILLFTDISKGHLRLLPEGVLIELLFFLKYVGNEIRVSSVSALVSGADLSIDIWEMTADQLIAELDERQRGQVVSFVEKAASRLRSIVFYIIDPLDYKYSMFVRERAYARGRIPLLPYTSVKIDDYAGLSKSPGGCVFTQWLMLLEMADECVSMPALEPGRRRSVSSRLFEGLWSQWGKSLNSSLQCNWGDFGVPKAKQQERWPITTKERDVWAGFQPNCVK